MSKLSGKALALACAGLVTDKKGEDPVILDLKRFLAPSDFYLIASAGSEPHLRALADHLESSLREMGLPPVHVCGYRNSGWIVMDFFDVMVHLFLKERRAYFNLEDLYADARRIDCASGAESQPKKVTRRKTPAKRR